MLSEIGQGTKKVAIFQDGQRDLGIAGHSANGRKNTMVTRLDDADLARIAGGDAASKGRGKGCGVGSVEAGVVHAQASLDERGREVAHGGEEEGDARLVAPDVGGFFAGFRHPDEIRIRIGVIEQA
jgi:hypothetical protein